MDVRHEFTSLFSVSLPRHSTVVRSRAATVLVLVVVSRAQQPAPAAAAPSTHSPDCMFRSLSSLIFPISIVHVWQLCFLLYMLTHSCLFSPSLPSPLLSCPCLCPPCVQRCDALQNMLQQLYCKGPFTVGIFRKSANARLCREVEARLEEDPEYALDDVPITVVGSVFKDFLRSLPNSLLDSRLLNKWIEAVTCDDADQQREAVDKLLKKLPSESLQLLQHVLCLLWHIAQRSSVNKMCPSNLAVCIGPSLLSSSKIISPVRREVSPAAAPDRDAAFLRCCCCCPAVAPQACSGLTAAVDGRHAGSSSQSAPASPSSLSLSLSLSQSFRVTSDSSVYYCCTN